MTDPDTPPLIRFMESHLGPIASGSIFEDPAIQVVRFDNQPFEKAVTYATLGLSHHVLKQEQGPDIRMELLLGCHERFASWNPGSLLAVVAKDLLSKHRALRQGDVLGPAGPIKEGSSCHGFWCTSPGYYPDAMGSFDASDPQTIFALLIPVTHDEIHFVWEHGWPAFEERLVAQDPDVWDLGRASIKLE